jgi:hypothetical protein
MCSSNHLIVYNSHHLMCSSHHLIVSNSVMQVLLEKSETEVTISATFVVC